MAQFIYPPISVNLAGLATEATLLNVEQNTLDTVSELQTANTTLSNIAAEDFATEATLSSIDGKVLTDAQLRATPVPVSGPLTDAELRAAAVPVSGPLTDAELRATAVPVSGPLTDAELRATAVPVSGPLTDAQLRATAVPVSAAALPLPAGAATQATLANIQTAVDALNARLAGSFAPEEFDYTIQTYVTSGNGIGEIASIVYKLGGAGGTTVATLAMAYDANNKLSTVTRS